MSGTAGERVLQRTFPSQLGVYQPFIEEVLKELRQGGWSESELFGVQMALEESISNGIRHGNKHDPDKQVTVECRVSAGRFWVQVCDEGAGYCRQDVPDCCDDDRLEVPGGRGLALIEAYMDRVEHNDRGNCLTLEKTRTVSKDPKNPKR
jgi:serine/threonine-protein kinase RsbW